MDTCCSKKIFFQSQEYYKKRFIVDQSRSRHDSCLTTWLMLHNIAHLRPVETMKESIFFFAKKTWLMLVDMTNGDMTHASQHCVHITITIPTWNLSSLIPFFLLKVRKHILYLIPEKNWEFTEPPSFRPSPAKKELQRSIQNSSIRLSVIILSSASVP